MIGAIGDVQKFAKQRQSPPELLQVMIDAHVEP
jgi:hypothetical protein